VVKIILKQLVNGKTANKLLSDDRFIYYLTILLQLHWFLAS